MERLSKKFYLGSVIIGLGIGLVLVIIGSIMSGGGSFTRGGPLMGVAWIPLLYAGIVTLMLYYKAWEAIQDGNARTSPGKAVGFLFIPFFNIYWAFQAIWGFSKDYNSYIERHSIETQKLPEALFLMFVIFSLLTWIPVVGIILMVVNYVINLMLVSKICDGVNAIPQTVE